jgi:hypothetical protein
VNSKGPNLNGYWIDLWVNQHGGLGFCLIKIMELMTQLTVGFVTLPSCKALGLIHRNHLNNPWKSSDQGRDIAWHPHTHMNQHISMRQVR